MELLQSLGDLLNLGACLSGLLELGLDVMFDIAHSLFELLCGIGRVFQVFGVLGLGFLQGQGDFLCPKLLCNVEWSLSSLVDRVDVDARSG